MRRPTLLIAPFLLLPLSLNAQQRTLNLAPSHTPAPAPEEKPTSLPVTHVSLYKNGVGFFEHTGHVTGNAAVTIDFTSGQLNDVLQSLTAIDLNGGRIAGAGYNSTTPLDQQLKTLPLNLDEDPTASDFYSAIRGARVEVHSGAVSITGRLLSVEVRSTPTSKDNSDKTIDTYFLTVVSDAGEVRTLELTAATSVRLVDTSLHNDVTRYLQLIDANRSQGLRHLTLTDNGTGPRELRISYISEVPIWKSTYRILFTNKGATSTPATLQGWSVVDNTTGADWTNVQLSLIAGAPQSFIQPLSQPIYSSRPEIPIAQQAQIAPQTFDSSMARDRAPDLENGAVSTTINGSEMKDLAVNTRNFEQMVTLQPEKNFGSGAVVVAKSAAMRNAAPPPPPPSYEQLAETSLTTNTQTAAFDDFFAYNLTEPITIRKNESALVPTLQTKITADPVTLVSYRNGSVSQPLRTLWLTNTSGITLDRGSYTLIENGAFAGEGLADPIHPNEKRLLSYAADQAVHVTTEGDKSSSHITLIRGSRGVLTIHHAETHEVTFTIHNSADTHRTVVTEVPVVAGYEIDSDPKPEETTPTVYRWRTEVDPGQTTKLHVGGTRQGNTDYYLTSAGDSQLQFILNETGHNAKLEAALQPILEARRHVSDAQAAVDATNAKLTSLRADEDRQRANVTALATADKTARDRFVHDLNTTEDAIAASQKDLTTQTTALEDAKKDLAYRIENLQLDEKL